jgi:predicted ATPase/DNA-binding SARP family transcriptional activator
MWNLQLLGGLVARSSERDVTRFRYHKAGSLLGYLAYFNHPNTPPHSRERLMEMLWPEVAPETGLKNLRNLLSALRPVLEPPGIPPGAVLCADRFSVRLDPAAFTCDVHQFEAAAKKASMPERNASERLALLEQAAELYQGALLPGYYEEWIGPESLRLSSLFLEVAAQLVPLLVQQERLDLALSITQRAVVTDPLSEAATWNLMSVLAAQQQPSQALRVYRQWERKLQEEWGETPTEQMRAYVRQLKKSPTVPTAPASRKEAAHDLPIVQVSTERSEPTERVTGSVRLLGTAFIALTRTRFFDRETEKARLSEMLSAPRTRLITVTGPGGNGKTRLALETVAHLMEQDEPQEAAPRCAAFVALGDVADPSRICEAILRAIGCQFVSGRDPMEQVTTALSRKNGMLLLLDNFEQLAEGGAEVVGELLARTPDLKCLVTSRQKLRLEGEHEFLLAPLPTSGGAQDPEALLRVSSIALFVDRAQMVRPDFQVTANNAAALAQLCDQLEGIPLALELAAARVQLLSIAHILEQINANRLDFLATRRRDATSRQRTLRSTLDWSYRLLSEPAQRLLAQVSVFRGGWTREASLAVCRLNEADTLEMLGLLRDNSLLQVEDEADGLRFTMLETVREYAAGQLERMGGQEEIQRRHARYFLAMAEEAEPHLTDSKHAVWMARLETEHDNLRAALMWCEGAREGAQMGLRLAEALWRFWEGKGYLSEGRAYLSEALGRKGAIGRTNRRAKALNGAGMLAYSQGDYEAARALHEESLAISRELGSNLGIARSMKAFARLSVRTKPERAARLMGAADALCQAIDSPLPPKDREEHNRNLSAVREALGDEMFTAVWAARQAMTEEEAITLARETRHECESARCNVNSPLYA